MTPPNVGVQGYAYWRVSPLIQRVRKKFNEVKLNRINRNNQKIDVACKKLAFCTRPRAETRLTVYRSLYMNLHSSDPYSSLCVRATRNTGRLVAHTATYMGGNRDADSDTRRFPGDPYRRYICKSNKDAVPASWPRSGRACERKI